MMYVGREMSPCNPWQRYTKDVDDVIGRGDDRCPGLARGPEHKSVSKCTKSHSHAKILSLLGGYNVFGIVFTSGDPQPTFTND